MRLEEIINEQSSESYIILAKQEAGLCVQLTDE